MVDKSKDPDSNIGVGGRAMFWEGVFGNTSGKPHETSEEEAKQKAEQNPREDVLSSYDHREVRPAKPKECA